MLPSEIRRRDFLNGMLWAAGGASVAALSPMSVFAAGPTPAEVLDPRMARGGNVPSAFDLGHWLRDGRLSFQNRSRVVVSKGKWDTYGGSFNIMDEGACYDAIVVGSGMAGLATA